MKDLFDEDLPYMPPSKEKLQERKIDAVVKKVSSAPEYTDSTEAELLGNILLNNSLIHEASAELDINNFSDRNCSIAFAIMQELSHEGLDITPGLIYERNKSLSLAWLTNLTYGVMPVTNINSYVSVLKSHTAQSQLVKLAHYIEDASLDGVSTQDLIATAELRLDTIRESVNKDGGFRPFIDVASDAYQHLEDLRAGINPAVSTGIGSLDKVLRGGGYPSELHVLVAKTGKGKSALAKQIAHHCALNDIPVGFVTAEMSDKAVLFRILSPEAGVASWVIQPGITPEKIDLLEQSLVQVGGFPIWIDDKTTNVFELRARAKTLKRTKGIKVLIVDYLQLLSVRDEHSMGSMSRTEEVAFVSRTLKKIAKELDIWVLALAQFNRTANKKDDAGNAVELEISQIAEAGAIEKDADCVWILDMGKYLPGQPERSATLTVGKNRESISDITIRLIFNGNYLILREENTPLILNPKQPFSLSVESKLETEDNPEF
jgi:replicative DNA helicase